MSDRLTDLTMCLHRQSERAVLVSLTGDQDEAVWLPKSQVELAAVSGKSGIYEVTMPEWLAIKQGLV